MDLRLSYNRYKEQKALVKYILMPGFKNRYFLEILEFMKSLEENNKKYVIRMASRLFELAEIFRDRYNETGNKDNRSFHFNVELSRSCSNYEYAYDYQEWENRLMLIHVFTCPCPIPEKIIWTSLDNERNYRDNHYRDIIKLTRKWLDDLLSGGSFYKKNKIFFTRKLEAIYFILRMNSRNSIINTFFYAKCKSRHMPNIISDRISEIFVHKFERYFNHSMVTDFLDLIARTDIKRLYNYNDFHYLDDICDFVFSKIVNNKETGEQGTAFSFKGRTLKSVIRLMNEWHLNLLNEIEGVENLENLDIPSFLRSSNFQIYKWDGLSLADYQCKTNNYTWVVSELRNSLSLYREGQKMRHCVVSYAQRCASGECSIFNISCKHKENNTIESMATLEINTSTKTLVQARGKFNHTVTDETMSIITQWTKENGIVIDLRYR